MSILATPRFIKIMTLLSILIAGCSSSDRSPEKPKTTAFFDLEGWFHNEARRLSDLSSIKRTIVLDGKEETHIVDQIDWEKELRPFIYSDINRVGWTDRYSADTIPDAVGKTLQMHYKALDDQLRVREIRIFFRPKMEKVEKILITKKRSSLIVENEQRLTYLPDEGYILVNRQSTPIFGKKELRVAVDWQ